MEVYPSVHWVEAGYSNVFLFAPGDELILIDSGPPRQANKILKYVEAMGRRPVDLTSILITHADWDHAGSAAEIQRRTGATVYAGKETAEWLQKGKSPEHLPQPIAFLMNHFVRFQKVPGEAIEPVGPQEVLPLPGELRALSTPGHTPDHFSFFSVTGGVLFTGDALGTRGGSLGLASPFITADVDAARESARRLLQLAPALFACGHGEPLQSHSNRDIMVLLQELKSP